MEILMSKYEKSAKIDWSIHAHINQPYRTHSLLWEQIDAMAIIETQDELEKSIQQMDEFTTASEMLSAIGVNTNGK
jgi:hypothetical protein